MKRNQEVKLLLDYKVPEYDEEKKQQLKKIVYEKADKCLNKGKVRMNHMQFVISQFRFLGKREWILQFMLVAIYIFIVYSGRAQGRQIKENGIYLSMFAPLLLMIQFCELAKVYRNRIPEIEMASKYSLHNLVMAHLLLYGLVDIVLLSGIIIFSGKTMDMQIIQIILYTLVPYNLMCLGCMEIMNRFRGRGMYEGCILYGIFLAIGFDLLGNSKMAVYQMKYNMAWLVFLCMSFGVLVCRIKTILKQLKNNMTEEVWYKI